MLDRQPNSSQYGKFRKPSHAQQTNHAKLTRIGKEFDEI